MPQPDFDLTIAHHYFAATCFNGCWELMDRPGRSADEDEELLLRALASLWHWRQRDDATATNLSVGYWQVSRAHAVLGRLNEARLWAERCRSVSDDPAVGVFYRAFAQEALARAAEDRATADEHLARGRALAAQIADPEERTLVERDLDTLEDRR